MLLKPQPLPLALALSAPPSGIIAEGERGRDGTEPLDPSEGVLARFKLMRCGNGDTVVWVARNRVCVVVVCVQVGAAL